jgi:D-psicose/D-tagatose/L-ribulose 3-epimerase
MKFAICNETYQETPWPEVCRSISTLGYDGVELAPFTFAPDVREVSAEKRREIARVATEAGLEIVGLHWLLVSPPGLHLTTGDAGVRARTVEYLRALIDFCADVGGRVMTFGSPKQRWVEEGTDPAEAWARAREGYRACLPTLAERGVILCMEALPAPESNFIRTSDEAAAMVSEIDHPNFRLMLDVKSMCAEPRPPAETIRRHAVADPRGAPLLAHFHANDANRRGPGMGETDFRPIAAALRETGYQGYVSVEVFDYQPDAETIARESLRYLREVFG